jgi:hypothetical protein
MIRIMRLSCTRGLTESKRSTFGVRFCCRDDRSLWSAEKIDYDYDHEHEHDSRDTLGAYGVRYPFVICGFLVVATENLGSRFLV